MGKKLFSVLALTGMLVMLATASEIEDSFMQALERGDFGAAHAMFDDSTASQLSVEQLAEVWQTLHTQLGEYQGRGPARIESISGRNVTVYRLQFATAALDARIAVNGQNCIDGFRLVPAAPPATEPEAATNTGNEQHITVRVANDLPGLIALPRGDGPFPAIVLVHGSGPNDRDETLGPNKPFRDLAEGLSRGGVAVLRFDKRTLIDPEHFVGRAFTVQDEVINDVLAALELLRARSEVDARHVYLLGHSLGAMLAPRIASQDERVAGLILLAAPARPLHEVVVEQIGYIAAIDGEIDVNESAQIGELKRASEEIATMTDAGSPQMGMLRLPESYWVDLNGYNPIATAQQLKLPMFIAQGGRDYQVTEAGDFERWNEQFNGRSDVVLKRYPDLNHLFISGTGMATPAEYWETTGVVSSELIDDIAYWIQREAQ